MAGIIEFYREVIYDWSDQRVKNWALVSGPGPVLTILATYLYFCTSAGPKFMRDRKPYVLRNVLILYNFFLVLWNTYIVVEAMKTIPRMGFNFRCQPVDFSDDPIALRVAEVGYLFFISKLIELLDTVFFVLRKKDRQITFLHLYHHTIMPFFTWMGVNYSPGGQPIVMGVLNSFVHVIMYGYYMLAAVGPEMQKYLWWKKYLTELQITQFVIIFIHNGQTLFRDCAYPRPLTFLLTLNALLFIYMFGSFYVKNYKSAKTEKTKKNAASDEAKERKLD